MKIQSKTSVTLSICGFRLHFVCSALRFAEMLSCKYHRFLQPVGRPHLVVHARNRPAGPPNLGTWPEIEIGRTSGRIVLARTDFEAEISSARSRSSVRTCRLACALSQYSLDAFLRSALQALLVERGKVLVHAAAVFGTEDLQSAFLLPGRSGMGKSTLAAIFGDDNVLSDELPGLAVERGLLEAAPGRGSLRVRRGKHPVTAPGDAALHASSKLVRVYGTPFHGRFNSDGQNLAIPLAGIFFLERGFGPRAVPLTEPQALVRLMSLIACFEKFEAVSSAVLHIARAATGTVPCFVFGFSKSESPKAILARLTGALCHFQ